MSFSSIFRPTNLFSLKDSNFTNSGAKSLYLPSPYSIKMAILNQAILTLGTEVFEIKDSKELSFIRDVKIDFFIKGKICVNNCFVTIQSQRDGKYRGKPSFREYVHISDDVEIIFAHENREAEVFLKKFIHRINYFGKRGCFFQFVEYSNTPHESNVKEFYEGDFSPGIIQEFDDFDKKSTFENISNFSSAKSKRSKIILTIPLSMTSSSKSFSCYHVN